MSGDALSERLAEVERAAEEMRAAAVSTASAQPRSAPLECMRSDRSRPKDFCPKCKPRRKPLRRSRTTVVLVNGERKTERG